MTVTAAQFRTDFPEFTLASYPDASVNFWLAVAAKLLRPARWFDMLDLATELYVAHNLSLEFQAREDAAAGGAPGVSTGAVTSMAVGPASISFDASAGLEEGAGNWNLTVYGTRFAQLVRMFGAGPIQVSC